MMKQQNEQQMLQQQGQANEIYNLEEIIQKVIFQDEEFMTTMINDYQNFKKIVKAINDQSILDPKNLSTQLLALQVLLDNIGLPFIFVWNQDQNNRFFPKLEQILLNLGKDNAIIEQISQFFQQIINELYPIFLEFTHKGQGNLVAQNEFGNVLNILKAFTTQYNIKYVMQVAEEHFKKSEFNQKIITVLFKIKINSQQQQQKAMINLQQLLQELLLIDVGANHQMTDLQEYMIQMVQESINNMINQFPPVVIPVMQNNIGNDQLQSVEAFQQYQQLTINESKFIEYKGYRLPLEEKQITDKIVATMCALLNADGGRIYIGVNNAGIVGGVLINFEQRDKLKLQISSLCQAYLFPKLTGDIIQVHFVPMMVIENNQRRIIPGRFVVKIIVKKGDPRELYMIQVQKEKPQQGNNQKEQKSYKSFERMDGNNQSLDYHAIVDRIKKRALNGVNEQKEVDAYNKQHFQDRVSLDIKDSEKVQYVSNRTSAGKQNVVCFNCSGRGHYKNQCPFQKRGSGELQKTVLPIQIIQQMEQGLPIPQIQKKYLKIKFSHAHSPQKCIDSAIDVIQNCLVYENLVIDGELQMHDSVIYSFKTEEDCAKAYQSMKQCFQQSDQVAGMMAQLALCE